MNCKLNVLAFLALASFSANGVHGLANLFPDDTHCNDGFIANKGSKICYKVYPDAGLDYWEASEYCQKLGGSLLSVYNLDDFLIRIRAAKLFFPDRRLRIEGYQVSENEFKDNDGNIIKLPTLHRVAKHSGSLTIWTQYGKGIRVFGQDSIIEKLGLVCERDRQGKPKRIQPIRVKPTRVEHDRDHSHGVDDVHEPHDIALAKLFPDDTNCKDGFIANKGSKICYKIFPDGALDYWEASKFCDKLGASLLTVEQLDDFLIRQRSAKTYYPDRHLRILGYQVSETEFKDNHGNVIKLPTLHRVAKHSGSLTIWTRKNKGIRVFGKKSITDKLGFVCQRDRQGEGKRIKPIKVRPHKPGHKREQPVKKFFQCDKRVRVPKQGLNLLSHHGYTKKQEYPDNYFCSWILAAPPGKTLRLGFKNFEVEGSGVVGDKCLFDYVQAYDGKHAHARPLYDWPLCGDRRPKSVISSGRFVNLTFVSDHSVGFQGFVADVKIIDEHDQKQSCRGRCDKFYQNYSCQCDEDCDEYDDCCYDYERICH